MATLNLDVRRFYNDDQKSYMAVFIVTGGATPSDNKIFVCTNEVLCPVGNEIPGRQVGVYVDCPVTTSSGSSGSSGTSGAGSSSSGSSSCVPPGHYEGTDFSIYPNRVLHTIASCPDMETHPQDAPPANDSTGFYRADTVTVMVNSEEMLNCVIDLIYNDIAEHCAMLSMKTPNFEMCPLQDCADNITDNYVFPE
jgi:hypothetical protein